jgi:hypothetical protein
MFLSELRDRFVQDNIECALKQAGDGTPFERLLVRLPTDIQPQPVMEMMFIPGLEEEVEDARFLQMFVTLGQNVPMARRWDLIRLSNHINVQLPLPAFGCLAPNGLFYYKYVLALSKSSFQNDQKVLMELYYMISFLIDKYFPHFNALVAGEITFEQAIEATRVNIG